jgi:hypothetical protein
MPPQSRLSPSPVADLLARTAPAPRQAYKSLTLWPLVLRPDAGACAAPPYVALADALDAGALRVDEVSPGGSVPHIRVENTGDTAVLVLFGEELRGAMQNRIANASFLVAPKSQLVIDVSCVEQGRWSRSRARGFAASRDVLSSSLRRKMAGRVTESLARKRGFHADQREVWDEVSARLGHARSDSATEAYEDYTASRAADLRAFATAFHPIEGQVGFVASIGDTVAGLEAIGRPEVFARVFPGLVRAYAIDAVDAELVRAREPERPGGPAFEAPEPFLQALAAAPVTVAPSLGLGSDLRLAAGGVAGCALVADEVVHLTAFPAPAS